MSLKFVFSRHWTMHTRNCMEKLLEVLIAIGDEVACLSVAELILRHWPSHSRALHVKSTIEESELILYAPRGIDKLEPKCVRLKFLEKRKATNNDQDDGILSKKLNQNIELYIPEASWTALADILLEILLPLSGSGYEQEPEKLTRSGDSYSNCNSCKGSVVTEKEAIMYEEQPQERRSSCLERLRSCKPGKEELDFVNNNDLGKIVVQFLEPFIVGGAGTKNSKNDAACSFQCAEVVAGLLNNERSDVTKFVQETSKNYGAYHLGHLLLKEMASRSMLYQDTFAKFLELEKLYYNFGSRSPDKFRMSGFMSEPSYHLCKIIESVALDYPFHVSGGAGGETSSSTDSSQHNCEMPIDISSLLSNKLSFWVHFFWSSGRLSVLDGNKAKAQEEFCLSLTLLMNRDNTTGSLGSVCLPHCKAIKKLTIDRVLHEINLLEVDFLLKKTVGEMIEKDTHSECVSLLAPLLISAKDVYPDLLYVAIKEGDEVTSLELSALDVLIKACEHVEPMGIQVLLNCHQQKLQILMVAPVKAISQIVSQMKNLIHPCGNSVSHIHPQKLMVEGYIRSRCPALVLTDKSRTQYNEVKKLTHVTIGRKNGSVVPLKTIGDIQSSLLARMSNIASMTSLRRLMGLGTENDSRDEQPSHDNHVKWLEQLCDDSNVKRSLVESKMDLVNMEEDRTNIDEAITMEEDTVERTSSVGVSPHKDLGNKKTEVECGKHICDGSSATFRRAEEASIQFVGCGNELTKDEREELELGIGNGLDQCFFCLYGLKLRSDSSGEDDLAMHKNTSRGDYQTKE
ncbi:unnamed protein product [Ilex paraguariensis]|uniref:Uncharacterized protein n=1 Tax=Ilex paraguariensis TaxID=185542 RepID=A0ABC8U284_9AQUA